MAKSRRKRKRADRGMVVFCSVLVLLLVVVVALLFASLVEKRRGDDKTALAQGTVAPLQSPVETQCPTPSPTPVITATPEPTPGPGSWEIARVVSQADPDGQEKLTIDTRVYREDTLLEKGEYAAEEPIFFGTGDEYTQLEGITTFRGSNYRDRASYGSIGGAPSQLKIVWSARVGEIDEWSGVGWTGQSSIVRWPSETVQIMNIYPEKKAKPGLTEVIYATLDGKIYFLDLEDGTPTRDPINIGAPIKGSLTVDPRGYPLLYCGQGIDEVNGHDVEIGTRVFSLIDGSVLHFIDGRDSKAIRRWYAFDCSPLVDAETDTLLQLGENAIVYLVKLNTKYDPVAGTISIDPETVRYLFKTNVSKRPGMENSLAIYNHYAYFGDNSGFIQCLDLNTLTPQWIAYSGDDIDSTMVIEEEAANQVAIYTANELDLRGNSGNIQIAKFDALTGEQLWEYEVYCKTYGDTNGGAFATPALGKGSLNAMIYFSIARTEDGGTLFALEKQTGNLVWKRDLKKFGWSSPVCVYDDSGKGYVIVGNSAGYLKLLDGLSGELICEVDVGSNMEGSPTVFDDTLVIGTRGNRILGIKIQ
ncbi:MAG: PQQ-binding-like beta-propeller repeat protein [Eubacteriales bacterium]|nr:PQQ-binding-like beta-propeller repeat protein [Eubacteriales bacterium]